MERVMMTQKVRLEDADRSFDIAFWQAQSSTALHGGVGVGRPCLATTGKPR